MDGYDFHFSHICMEIYLTRFLDHCCYQSLQIFPQNSGFLCREFWSRLPRKGKQVYCPRVLKATEDEASCRRECKMGEGSGHRTHEFWAPQMVVKGKGNGTLVIWGKFRLFRLVKDSSIWPEGWRNHSSYPSSCHPLVSSWNVKIGMSLEALKAFEPHQEMFGYDIHTDPHKVLWMSRECMVYLRPRLLRLPPECWVPWRVDFKRTLNDEWVLL